MYVPVYIDEKKSFLFLLREIDFLYVLHVLPENYPWYS